MFTIEQIKQAHSKVKSGADFPAYIQEVIKLGVKYYTNYVCDGHTEYSGEQDFKAESEAKYSVMKVAENCNEALFKQRLAEHQQGKSDYMSFCRQAAELGIDRWEIDTNAMTCIYYDKKGKKILVEQIPG